MKTPASLEMIVLDEAPGCSSEDETLEAGAAECEEVQLEARGPAQVDVDRQRYPYSIVRDGMRYTSCS